MGQELLTPERKGEVQAYMLANRNQPINAVRLIREYAQCGMKEAWDEWQAYKVELGWEPGLGPNDR